MPESTTRKSYAITRKQVGRVTPLRLLPRTSSKPRDDHSLPLPPSEKETIATTLHAIQNCLQTVGMSLDLMQLAAALPPDYEPVQKNVKSAGRFLLELREYCCPPAIHRQTKHLAETVEAVVQEVTREWQRPGLETRVQCHDPCAMQEADWRQIEKALTRTIACAYAMLPAEGGEVFIKSGVRQQSVHQFIDLAICIRGAVPFTVEEKTLFLPFTSVNDRQLGLSLVLAQRSASQLGGHLLFHKVTALRACFTLWFRV